MVVVAVDNSFHFVQWKKNHVLGKLKSFEGFSGLQLFSVLKGTVWNVETWKSRVTSRFFFFFSFFKGSLVCLRRTIILPNVSVDVTM